MKKFLQFLILFLATNFIAESQEFENPVNLGGKHELNALIDRAICYPLKDLEEKRKASIEIDFKVEADGSVTELSYTQGSASEEMLHEAMRVFELFIWKPANNMGIPEPFRHSMSISFHPAKYAKLVKTRGYACPPDNPLNADPSGKVFEQVEEAAIAGKDRFALSKFLRDNLVYPKAAFERNISGEVLVRLVVEPNGLPSNIHIVNSLGGGCDEEAIRIVSKLRWQAAKNAGLSVRSWVEIPIIFKL